jgi:two-component system cell cycle sensor histidine kinase/response regulator CckA
MSATGRRHLESGRMSDISIGNPIDRSDRQGNALLVLLLAVLLVGALAASFYLTEDGRTYFVLWFLAALAAIGVLGLFLFAIGVLQLSGRSARNDLTKLITDSSYQGILVTDTESRVIYANKQYMALAGAAEGSVVRPVERLFTGASDVSEAVYRLAQAARERRSHIEELRMAPGLDGQTAAAWYKIRVRPIERNGRHESIWSVVDVTADRKSEEGAVQELQLAVNFLDHAPAGFFSAEPSGNIAYMNATLSGWLDYDIAQSLGDSGLTLKQIAASGGAALLDAVTGVAGQVKTEVIDLDLRRRGGQALPVRLLHRVSYGHDGTPGPSRTIVLNRSQGVDTSEGRAAEVRFARFFHNTPMAIAAVGRDGEINQTNASFARLFGDHLKLGGDGDRSVAGALLEKDRPLLIESLKAVTGGQTDVAPIDVTLIGGQRSARVFVTPVADRQSGDEAAIVYLLDTTEQRALQEQFTQAQKMQAVGQLAGGVAHDFNNVLTAIIGYSDLLLASHRPTDPSFQDIMQIKQNANRAASLVRQLLAFSRRQTLRPQVIQLNDAVSDVQMLLKRLLGEKVELDVRYGRDLWPIKADVNQFEQVVVNLAVNARDAMPEGGKLTLRTSNVTDTQSAAYNYKGLAQADYVLLEVEDTGSGMSAEVMEKIFEPFFTTKEIGKGTGLGLSMVFGIIKQSNGYIFCDSAIGRGTTFRIFLPRHVVTAEEIANVKAEETKVAAPQDLTGQGTILLVEDEEAVRAFGARALRSRGYTVLEAGTGVEALELVEDHGDEIVMVVSDVVMPEMDGPTLFTELKKRGRNYQFVFASGYAEEAFKKNLPEAEQEAFAFLPKPYSLKQLIEAVKQVKS